METEICNNCGGTGEVLNNISFSDYYPQYEFQPCPRCKEGLKTKAFGNFPCKPSNHEKAMKSALDTLYSCLDERSDIRKSISRDKGSS